MSDSVVIFFMDASGRLRHVKSIPILLNMLESASCVVLNHPALSVGIRGKAESTDGISIIRHYSVRMQSKSASYKSDTG